MRVLAFGSYDARLHPRVGVLIAGLADCGDEVVEVNVPLGLDTAARVAILRRPWLLPVLAARLIRCWAVLTFAGLRTARRLRPQAVLVGYLGHFDVLLARRLFPRTTVVLDHLVFAADTAADRGATGAGRQRALARLDLAALRSADVVLLDTVEHAALVPADLAARTVVVSVGAPAAWFEAGAAAGHRPAGPGLRVVFFGLFTPLQGTPVIGSALGRLADVAGIEVLMIGHGQDLAAARAAAAANPRVTWRDWLPADDLPGLVAGFDVCLGIFGTGVKTARVVPNKVFQGAAAGCAILTSDTPPQRAALGEAAVFVPAGDDGALADALRDLAASPERVVALRSAAAAVAAERFTPAAVVAPLRAALTDRLGRHERAG